MFDRDNYKIDVTLEGFNHLPPLYFHETDDEVAQKWVAFLTYHPEILAIQVLKNGERMPDLLWSKPGLSVIDLLKAFGM